MVATADLYQNQQGQTGTLINVGQVNFTQDLTTNVVHVTGSVRGLPQAQNNMFGFHVHEYGTTGNNCNAAGLHYNPKNVTHGAPWDSVSTVVFKAQQHTVLFNQRTHKNTHTSNANQNHKTII